MNASPESLPQGEVGAARWLLLIHQLPPKPDYLRVKIRRRLARLGAIAVKHTVYLLRNDDEALEDFHWLREEIQAAGGSAVIAEAVFVEGLSDEEVEAMLQSEAGSADDGDGAGHRPPEHVEPGRTWVTRRDVHVDRIASAWLIRKYIDADARIAFVAARGYKPLPGELRFDMYQAEYTHEGEDCTFQTLARRFGIRDPAVRAIGEMVHDIDCKDERFGRPETAGIASVIRGIADAHDDDAIRLARGAAVLDDLHAALGKRR